MNLRPRLTYANVAATMISPGTIFTVTALLHGDSGNNCTASSKLDKVAVRIVQIH